MEHKEIECRFLEIDKDKLVKILLGLGAKDLGEVMLEETIIYDQALKWKEANRFVRIRKTGERVKLSYKEHNAHAVDGAYEIEFDVSDYKKAELLFEKVGLVPYRHQQKKRHTLELDGVTFDIDTWPRIPTYVELEAENEGDLKKVVLKIGYDWKDAIFNNAAWVIEEKYGIPVRKLRWFTFDRME
ncbi:MAG: CYTH domain-containing protein [Candidatus Campbellbacteria bacterium]|nr:CYTH domain-containing protein [Candidatus Campbellbacteria bacterium]